jgi:hypothetical protein
MANAPVWGLSMRSRASRPPNFTASRHVLIANPALGASAIIFVVDDQRLRHHVAHAGGFEPAPRQSPWGETAAAAAPGPSKVALRSP